MGLFDSHKKKKKKADIIIIEETPFIIFDDCHYKKHDPDDEQLELEIIKKLTGIVDRLTTPPKRQKVKQVLTQIFNNNKTIIMSLSLPSNQKAPIVVSLVDADSLAPVTATFVAVSETSDNLSAATVDADGNLVGVAAGTGNLTSVNTWTYTDSNTKLPVTTDLTTVTPFEITTVVTAERVLQVVTLGTPVAQ